MQAALDDGRRHGPEPACDIRRAGLSNNSFYRHVRSKDDLVLAILDDGRRTLLGYLEHLMAEEATGEGKAWRWIEGMMAQAVDPDAASATRAGNRLGAGMESGRLSMMASRCRDRTRGRALG
jgi:AcrR family transcriptional regulator